MRVFLHGFRLGRPDSQAVEAARSDKMPDVQFKRAVCVKNTRWTASFISYGTNDHRALSTLVRITLGSVWA